MTLKDLINNDINTVFLNQSETAEEISYEGETIVATVEEVIGQPIIGRMNRSERPEGVYGRSVYVYMPTPAILPVQGKRVTMGREGHDPERWTVREVNDDSGMIMILLEAVDS